MLLGALWFVPTANATPESHQQTVAGQRQEQAQEHRRTADAGGAPGAGGAGAQAAESKGADTKAPTTKATGNTQDLALADTGSVDTTPYLFGGVAFVAAGGALVTGALRRSRSAHR
nr:cell wall protein [Streptomyces olivoverticillatus]